MPNRYVGLRPSPVFDPLHYLLVELPRAAHGATQENGTIQLVVTDRDPGDVVYQFTPSGLTTRSGLSDQVDLTIAITTPDLEALSKGSLDLHQALASRRLKVMGNERFLLLFSALFFGDLSR